MGEKRKIFNKVVMEYALSLQRVTNKPLHFMIEKAEMAKRLEEEMKKGIVAFTFMGQDNMEHNVRGTLKYYLRDFKRPYRSKPDNRFLLYYDIKIGAWRTFQAAGLMTIRKDV